MNKFLICNLFDSLFVKMFQAELLKNFNEHKKKYYDYSLIDSISTRSIFLRKNKIL